MEDRELLKLAAVAAGLSLSNEWDCAAEGRGIIVGHGNGDLRPWNPLMDDGEALRLAICLRIDLTFYNGFLEVHAESSRSDGLNPSYEKFGEDLYCSTRRAIVRAAAEIGKAMP